MAGSAVIGALRVNLGIDSAEFQNGLKSAQGALGAFGSAIKTGLVAAAVAAGAAIGSLANAVKDTINEADEMSKAAAKIGVPIEELSRLKYAADLSGVSFEGLQTAVGKLSKVMNDAKNGSKAALDTFAQLGVSATNADGSLKSASQVLAEISNKFAAMPDGAEKTALAMKLMGRSGADMIPLLNGGADALAKLMAEADTFGQVFTKEMGANAETFNDNISRLQGVLGNLAAKIATELLPYMVQFTDWLVANAPQIVAFATSVASITGALVSFGQAVVSASQALGPLGEIFTTGIFGLVSFGQTLTTIGGQIATFLGGAWAQFEGAWDGIVVSVNAMKDQVLASVMAMTQELVNLIIAMKDQAVAAVSAMVTEIIDWMTNKLSAAWDTVTSKIAAVKDTFADLYDAVVGHSYVPDMVTEIGQWMSGLDANMVKPATAAAGETKDAFSGLGSSMDSAFSGFGSSIAEAIKGTKNWSDVLTEIAGKLADLALNSVFGGSGGAGGFVSGLLGGLIGFAQGGSIMPGGAGAIDSQVVAFRKSPSEQVDVYDPGKVRSGSGTADIRVYVDQDGNWRATVERIAEGPASRAAGRVAQGVPAMVDARTDERRTRRLRPRSGL